jgi:hypothetical protein
MISNNNCLPTIRCGCGFELCLLLPDVKVLGQAIEKHALDHKKKFELNEEQTEGLKDSLITQIFDLLSKKSKH